jgi:dTDP-4-dehydrorhamnose reductase
MKRLRIAVIGKSGQVAQALVRAAGARTVDLFARGRPQLDLARADTIKAFLDEMRPSVVVNAGAYTAVDQAETEPDRAARINAGGAAIVAGLCRDLRIPLIHVSTDYVFDGRKRSPYLETDPVAALNQYGATKACGEALIKAVGGQHVILRTAWVYSPYGSNFVKTMLRRASATEVVRVVSDQSGTPTSADDIACSILEIAQCIFHPAQASPWGTYHLTAQGQTTWHEFAAEIFRHAAARGLKVPRLEAIASSDYRTLARRPAYSVLDNSKIARTFGVRLPPWQDSLSRCLDELLREAHGCRV